MVERWAKAVIKHRRWVVAFIIISSIFFLYQARKVKIYYQKADLTSNNHPFMKLQYKMEEVFGGNNLKKKGGSKMHGLSIRLLAELQKR